jgi:preprotein translocase subunit SecG
MITLITILIILACVVLAFFILIQNPKGGGLSGSFGSIGSQVMGVKQSTDVMEKGTWTTIGIIAALCIVSVMFFERPKEQKPTGNRPATSQQQQAPAAPAQGAPAQ